jgi:hypothetical protein
LTNEPLYGTIQEDFLRTFSASLVGRTKPGFNPKMVFNCQSQLKGFMRLDEEARKLQRQIEDPSVDGQPDLSDLPDAAELRAILRNGIFEFEESLKGLPPDQQEVAYILYLQKIREVTCTMHIAVDSLVDKNKLGNDMPGEEMFAELVNVVPSWHYIAHLYGY